VRTKFFPCFSRKIAAPASRELDEECSFFSFGVYANEVLIHNNNARCLLFYLDNGHRGGWNCNSTLAADKGMRNLLKQRGKKIFQEVGGIHIQNDEKGVREKEF